MPIWRAAEAGNPHVVKELLMALAPQQLSYQNKVRTFSQLFHSSENIHNADGTTFQLQNGDSVMHYVLRQNNSELLRILIEAGGPVDIQNVRISVL